MVVVPDHVRECLAGAGSHRGRRRRYPVLVRDASTHLGVLVVANVIRLPCHMAAKFDTVVWFRLSTTQAVVSCEELN